MPHQTWYWAIPKIIQPEGVWGHGISRGTEKVEHQYSRGQLNKKRSEISRGDKKKLSGISKDPGFWPWNDFQVLSDKFTEYPGVKLCFAQNSRE